MPPETQSTQTLKTVRDLLRTRLAAWYRRNERRIELIASILSFLVGLYLLALAVLVLGFLWVGSEEITVVKLGFGVVLLLLGVYYMQDVFTKRRTKRDISEVQNHEPDVALIGQIVREARERAEAKGRRE